MKNPRMAPDHRERDRQDQGIAHAERDIGERDEHHHRHHRSEPVEAVDDIDGIGQARHRNRGDRNGDQGNRQRHVDQVDVDPHDLGVEQIDRHQGGGHGRQQPLPGADALGHVLDEAGDEGGHDADHQQQERMAHDLRIAYPGCHGGSGHRQHNAEPADTGHGPCMELLHAVQIPIGCNVGVQARIPDNHQGHDKRYEKSHRQCKHRSARSFIVKQPSAYRSHAPEFPCSTAFAPHRQTTRSG